ncbi:MAG TPA: cytochrome c biogenesis protein CcdA [Puia sp.]|uniref:protein-disulfide reductase DsbD family protein n=1 Tax=Puia sp. TaxID=2045100 RepID=UPI002C6F1CD7|nr:cytochrome c biogenesis protein CcdA [Puia sp.]HVU99291.1 cytochrome c biogenesis protein CcdA [Puia sp.]
MNRITRILAFCLLAGLQQAAAQTDTTKQAVTWDFTAQPGADGKPVLVLHAHILDGWRLYSTTMPDSLPNSRVALDSSAKTTISGIDEQGQSRNQQEPLFNNATTRSFTGDARWLVHLQSSAADTNDLKGTVTFMAIYKDSVIGPLEVPFRYGHTAGGALVAKAAGLQESASSLKLMTIDLAKPVNNCGGTGTEGTSGLLGIFVLGLLGGLVGLVMPCTFPMIPLTVSFFTKRSASRSKGIANAFLYGFFIFLVYVLISLPFYFLKGNNANILNTISTNIWINMAFAAIFIVFALSFFGLFEITLPSSISNSVDAKSNISSVGGIFFMALTLVIVSFSCTGPILGSLLVGALDQNGGALQLTVAMAGFGVALGLPFALFALFPNWLHSLPRSGNWMNTVKVVFGFVELALALKYLSNADLVEHWGLLKRETFFVIWIAIDFACVAYLFGFIKFHKDGPSKITNGRKALAAVFLVFGLYMIPGLTNSESAKLPLFSGIVPPWNYSWYGNRDEHLINNYERAIQLAKEQHKPVLIDFTGWACTNCRNMEEHVWPKPGVQELITNDYILVSLYVDDRKLLPDDQQGLVTTADGSKKEIRTIGDKFATLQSENFKSVSQPLYVLISPDQKLLTRPVGYTPDAKAYAQWLQCGLDAFKQLQSTAKAQ